MKNNGHSGNAIEATDVRLTYDGGKEAVRGVSFQVNEREFFGFLGPNGAGKTTTIKMLTTLLRPTDGRILVRGIDVEKNPVRVRASIGYTAQDTGIDPELTAAENVRFATEAYRVPRREREDRVKELLALVGLEDVADKRASTLSGGMKKRLDIATSLVHRPPLLFLDEPTTGLDPKARLSLWDHLRALNDSGTTMFLTTQYLEEADRLADRIALIDQGHIVAVGSPSELKAQVGMDALEIHVEDAETQAVRARDILLESGLIEIQGEQVGLVPRGVVVTSPRARRIGADVLLELKREGFGVEQFNVRSPTLDDVFLAFTGGTLAEAQAKAAAAASENNGRGIR